jgi:hypothetical protein
MVSPLCYACAMCIYAMSIMPNCLSLSRACVMECERRWFPRIWDMTSYPGAVLRAGDGKGKGKGDRERRGAGRGCSTTSMYVQCSGGVN